MLLAHWLALACDIPAFEAIVTELEMQIGAELSRTRRERAALAVLAAQCSMLKGKHDEAVKTLTPWVCGDEGVGASNYLSAKLNLGRCHQQLGNLSGALEAFDDRLEQRAGQRGLRRQLRYEFARALLQAQKFAEAEQVASEGIVGSRQSPVYHHSFECILGDAQANQGKTSVARLTYRALLANELTPVATRQSIYGWELGQAVGLSNWQEACTLLSEINSDDSFSTEYRDMCGAFGVQIAILIGWYEIAKRLSASLEVRNGQSAISRFSRSYASGTVAGLSLKLGQAQELLDEACAMDGLPEQLAWLVNCARFSQASLAAQRMQFKKALTCYRNLASDSTVEGTQRNFAAAMRRLFASIVGPAAREPGDLEEQLPCPESPLNRSMILVPLTYSALRATDYELAYALTSDVANDARELHAVRLQAHGLAVLASIFSGRFLKGITHANCFLAMSVGTLCGEVYGRAFRAMSHFFGGKYAAALQDISELKAIAEPQGEIPSLVSFIEAAARIGPECDKMGRKSSDQVAATFNLSIIDD